MKKIIERDQNHADIETHVPPRGPEIPDSPFTEKIRQPRQRGEPRHDQACAQQPLRGQHPCGIADAEVVDVAKQRQNKTHDGERNQHRVQRMTAICAVLRGLDTAGLSSKLGSVRVSILLSLLKVPPSHNFLAQAPFPGDGAAMPVSGCVLAPRSMLHALVRFRPTQSHCGLPLHARGTSE